MAAKPIREYVRTMGLDLEDHRSRLITPELLEWASLVVYMDNGNKERLLDVLYPGGEQKYHPPFASVIGCLASWLIPIEERIPDPAFEKFESFRFKQIVAKVVRASINLAEWLKA